jgi:hypothetical protein
MLPSLRGQPTPREGAGPPPAPPSRSGPATPKPERGSSTNTKGSPEHCNSTWGVPTCSSAIEEHPLRSRRGDDGMARTFSIVTVASPSLLLVRARRVACQNGVTLVGNESSGCFSHKMLRGEYRMSGRTVIVTITYKHRLVPWSLLERRLRGLFGSGPRMARVSGKSTAPTARRTREGRRASGRPAHHRRHPHRR